MLFGVDFYCKLKQRMAHSKSLLPYNHPLTNPIGNSTAAEQRSSPMISTYMPPSREVENDGCRPERHEQVELGSENDDPDALERPLDRPSRVPGGRHGGPQHAVGHLRAVDLETAHLDLRGLHHHKSTTTTTGGENSSCRERYYYYRSKDGNLQQQDGLSLVSSKQTRLKFLLQCPACCSSNLL